MNRIDIINSLVAKNGYKRYLEIGVRDGECFNAIQCETKVGVDPDKSSKATIHCTSDEYFESCMKKLSSMGPPVKVNGFYDLIFIDGLHHADQVEKDIDNALKCLSEGGTIVMHDCLPTSKRMQEIPLQEQNEWTGNVWLAYLFFRCTKSDLSMCVVDTDWGCGIIQRGSQTTVVIDHKPTYEEFEQNKHEWMNIISVEDFKTKYLS